ncbi:hypothetical protein DSO57_1039139 [Entomophthora muscae]|uniref:Uncharacterized protein n=1 Tax=Entomophthora muscae TaxID=34485 RepID=A0ACC2SBF2_9FUNG|nr:hypothetical protein DSO57_1039139 [Entomophthora muscae]
MLEIPPTPPDNCASCPGLHYLVRIAPIVYLAFQARPASPVGVQPESGMGHDNKYHPPKANLEGGNVVNATIHCRTNLSLLLFPFKMSLAPKWEIQLFSFLILQNSLAPLILVASDPTVHVLFCGKATHSIHIFVFVSSRTLVPL